MVRFNDDSLEIRLPAISRRDAVDEWITLVTELISTLSSVDFHTAEEFASVYNLLSHLVPDYSDAVRMADNP